MSYILDALKKSEQERGNGSVPGVQTIHSSSINYHHDKRAVWPWFLLAAVIINIVALVYFVQTRHDTQPAAAIAQPANTTEILQPPAAIARKTGERPSPATVPGPVATEARVNTPAQPVEQVFISEEPLVQQTEQPALYIVDLYDLPLNIKQHIPELNFSAHVYSSNARQRSLVINDRFMEEGEYVNNELMLIEITADGAVFDYRGYRFRTSVLSGWN